MKPEVAASSEKFARFPVIAELWMIVVLVVFFVIRIVGSNTGQNFIRKLGVH